MNNVYVNSNDNCCGLGEVSFSNVKRVCTARTLKKKLAYALDRDEYDDEAGYAGLHMTEAYSKRVPKWTTLEKALSKLGTRTYLGKNPSTGNHIYSWTIPASKLLK